MVIRRATVLILPWERQLIWAVKYKETYLTFKNYLKIKRKGERKNKRIFIFLFFLFLSRHKFLPLYLFLFLFSSLSLSLLILPGGCFCSMEGMAMRISGADFHPLILDSFCFEACIIVHDAPSLCY